MASYKSSEAPCIHAQNCVFDNFPVELFHGIFSSSNLEIQDLKACSEVSYPWYCALRQSKSLSSKTITTLDAESIGFWEYIGRLVELLMQNMRLSSNEFRFRNFGLLDLKILPFFLPAEFCKETITRLEIVKHDYVWFESVCIFISTFENLAHLTLSQIRRNPTVAFLRRTPNGIHPTVAVDLLSALKNLISLRIHTTTRDFLLLVHTIGTACQNLQSLHLDLDNLPVSFQDRSSAIDEFVKIMHNNATTLLEITLDNFHVTIGHNRKNRFRQGTGHELLKAYLETVFLTLVVHLTEIRDWGQPGLLLSKIDFRFPMIKIEGEGLRGTFLQFLRTQTSLKHLCLAQVFLVPENSSLRDLVDSAPVDCYLSIEGVASVVGTFGNPVIHRFADHGFEIVEDPDESDSDDDDDAQGDDGIELETDDEEELGTALRLAPVAPIDPELTNILSHLDSQVILRTNTIDLTLRFACRRSIENISFLNDYIRVLTKIKIDQVGVALPAKIVIGDVDIQNIIAKSNGLAELSLEFCNLEVMTDYGLTGIGPDACRRMALANGEEMQGDLLGRPISDLKNLRSLKLSHVGNQVTDISAVHAFKGLQSLSSFGLSEPNMTAKGYRKLHDLFSFNQMIKIDLPLKIRIDEAVAQL